MGTGSKTTRGNATGKRAEGDDSRERRLRDPVLQRAIARRAYEIYEAAGRPQGQEVAHWLQAEAEILGR